MTRTDSTAAPERQGRYAPLTNVLLAGRLMDHLMQTYRDASNLPRMGVLFGPSGFGKSFAAAAVANRFRAYYVECRSYFTKKSLLLSVLEQMAIQPGKTIYEMVNQIGTQLEHSGRPLIIDEMDHIVDRNLVELIRDVYEVSGAAILMVGEEQFPRKLRRWERFHNRILDWQRAEPSDLEDAKKLAKLYAPEVAIAEELLAKIVEASRGVTRRICVNIESVRQEARKTGARSIDAKAWGSRRFDTGEAPLRSAA